MEGKKIKIAEIDGKLLFKVNGEEQVVEDTIVDTSLLDNFLNAQQESVSLNPDSMQQELAELAETVYTGVITEFRRQFNKWGPQFHTVDSWNSITVEEYGEMVSAMNKEDWDEAMKEGIEMIACAIQLLYEVKRRKEGRIDGEYTRQG